MEINIREATASDLEDIVALLADDPLGATREDPRHPLNPRYTKAFEAIHTDPNQFLAVACEGARIVGTLQLSFIPGITRTGMWRGQIEGVRIAADQRGKGLGEVLFSWAIERCRQEGCDLVQLTTDKSRPDAHRFYDRLGFEASHIGYKIRLT